MVVRTFYTNCKDSCPATMREFTQVVKAKPGRHFLTGDADDLAYVRGKLLRPAATHEDHSTKIVLGNIRTEHRAIEAPTRALPTWPSNSTRCCWTARGIAA